MSPLPSPSFQTSCAHPYFSIIVSSFFSSSLVICFHPTLLITSKSLSVVQVFYVFTSDDGTETTPLHLSGPGSAPLRLLSWCEVYQWLIFFKKKLRNISLQSVTIIQSTVMGFKPATLQLNTDRSTKVRSPLPKPSILPPLSLSFF